MTTNVKEFNDDELEAPAWLNDEFFLNVLKHSERSENITIDSIKLTPGTAKGDHYASVMFRGVIDYKQDGAALQKSLIIKTMPEAEGLKKELLGETSVFKTEIGMYTEVLPRFEQILRDIGDNTVLKAPCIYHALKPRQVIIFEDIVPQGYSVLRERSITLEEAKLALLKLAKWHAISYKLIKEDPAYFKNYFESIMSQPNIQENEFITGGMKLFIEFLDNTPSLIKYKPYFEAMQADYLQKTFASFGEYNNNPQEDAHYVLCHGDFHAKNLMVKSDAVTGKLIDVMLLDFQLSYVGPIVNDMMYSIVMLMTAEMRAKNQDELFYYYFSNFQQTLQKIGFNGDIPKMLEFRAQIMRHKHMLIYLLTTMLPFWYAFIDGMEINDLIGSEEARRSMYKLKDFIQEMDVLLPNYLHLGYLEN